MSDSIEDRARRNDFRDFLDKWTFGQVQLDAIMKACNLIVTPLEKETIKIPEVQKGVRDLKAAIKEFKQKFDRLDVLEKKVDLHNIDYIEKCGRDKFVYKTLFALGIIGTVLGGLNYFNG